VRRIGANDKRRAAAALIAAVGAIHLLLVPEYLDEQPYLGILFAAGAAVCALVSTRLWQFDDAASWVLGSIAAAGMALGFVMSRTTGLPGFHESEWELSGIVSVLLEISFIAVAAGDLRRRRRVRLVAAET
jgi:drug/metabolite transporter (DMT)-like permease